MMSLLETARRMAKSWFGNWVERASLADLTSTLPIEVFEGAKEKPEIQTSQKKSAALVSHRPKKATKRKPQAHKSGKIRKTLGNLTTEKRQEIMKRVGDLSTRVPEYKVLRDRICRDLSLNRRQVTQYICGVRMVKNGTSNVAKARAGRKKKQ